MLIDLTESENKIAARMKELCSDYNFMIQIHPGSLASLGFVINNVTALVRFSSHDNDLPKNLTAQCVNQINTVKWEIHVVYIDYRGASKIYGLTKALHNHLRGCRDLLVFCEGEKNTQHYSTCSNFRFLEVDGNDRACFSYSFDLEIRYSETYMNKR